MTKLNQRTFLMLGAGIFTVSILASGDANAANNFNSIASNLITSIGSLPTLLTGLAYMFGLLLAVLGIMKIKDHVENPGQTPLKDGVTRLVCGGGLFAIPILSDAMKSTVGTSATQAGQASLTAISFSG